MKTLGIALGITLAVFSYSTIAADAAKEDRKPTPQQTRMAACNKDAGERKGEERKAFMKSCLSDKRASQQDRVKACNKQAEGKSGDTRKTFISECLRG